MSVDERLCTLEKMVADLGELVIDQGKEIQRLQMEVEGLHGDAAIAQLSRTALPMRHFQTGFSGRV